MATSALKDAIGLERQDAMLSFGSTGAISAGTIPFGKTTANEDGTYLDLGNTDLEGMAVVVNFTTGVTGSGTGTINVSVSNDSGSSWTVIATSGAIAASKLTEGAQFNVPIPRGHEQGNLMKVELVAVSLTAGEAEAYVDTYVGA